MQTNTPEPPLPDGWSLERSEYREYLRGPGWVVYLDPSEPGQDPVTGPAGIVLEDSFGGPGLIPWEVVRWLAWRTGVTL